MSRAKLDLVNMLGMLWIATLIIGLGTLSIILTANNPAVFGVVSTLFAGLMGAVVGHYFAMRQAAQAGRSAIDAAVQTSYKSTVVTPNLSIEHPSTTITNEPMARPE